MKISVVTPTADRPVAFALLERWMARQTLTPDEWVVADGGTVPVVCTMRQEQIHDPMPPGRENFANNLLNGIEWASGDILVFCEDDDWLDPTHLERTVKLLDSQPNALAAGDPLQRYYFLPSGLYRTFDNTGASLCQTAIRRTAIDALRGVIARCQTLRTYGIDTHFWRSLQRETWALARLDTVVGLKGLPGQPGLGIGHRPFGAGWTADPMGEQLREWVGEDADTIYASLPTALDSVV